MHKLSQKMIRITFLSVVSVFLVISLILYTALSSYNMAQADGMTKLISMNNGEVPQLKEYQSSKYIISHSIFQIDFDEESSYRTRYFIVYLDSSSNAIDTNIKHIASVTVSEATELSKQVLNKVSPKKKTTGCERLSVSYCDRQEGEFLLYYFFGLRTDIVISTYRYFGNLVYGSLLYPFDYISICTVFKKGNGTF